MPPLVVLLADEAAVGMTRIEAAEAASAEALVMGQHPCAVVHAMDGALVTEENRVRMLGAWLRQQGQ
ncbi:MAG: hypothetical protein FJY58_10495 [Betaproteobacteria bacterium]|nr:hypothetical protein [Betaproteobacteria bacterium]